VGTRGRNAEEGGKKEGKERDERREEAGGWGRGCGWEEGGGRERKRLEKEGDRSGVCPEPVELPLQLT
jgi:hypothetical protein